jgi:lysophospholipase L1-like esterase
MGVMFVRGLRVLVLGVAALVVVAAIELGVAVVRRGARVPAASDPYTPAGSVAEYAGGAAERSPLQADLDLLWRNRPGAEITQPVAPAPFGHEATWTARINSDGFRGPERSRAQQEDEVFRILCIGDAVTYGFNVDQQATYPASLEKMLAAKYRKRRFEVVNAGVAGWSWIQGAAFLLRDGLALRPDLIIVAHGTDDQLWPADVTDSERMWLLSDPVIRRWASFQIAAQGSLVYRVVRSWLDGAAPVSTSPACRQQVAERGVCHRVSLPEIETTVRRLAETARAAGVGLLLLNLDFLGTRAADALRRAVRRDGVRFLDSVEWFRFARSRLQIRNARELGLAPPRVPLVERGTIGIPPPPDRGARMRFRVGKPADGAEVGIRGRSYPDTGFSVDQKLYDDGTHGDEVARDGVFSATVEMPRSVATLRYRFFLDGVPEFRDPPSVRTTNSDRVMQFNRDGDAPIETFGARYDMTDEVHPDANGHARIASGVLREIEGMPSFRRFVGLPIDETKRTESP